MADDIQQPATTAAEPKQRPPHPAEPVQPGPIWLRLALAFLAVALAAVALLAGLTAALAAADVSHLASQQRKELASALAVAAGSAWDRTGSWAGADLAPVLDLATRTGADAQLRDQAGRAIVSTPGFAARTARPQFSTAIVVRGQRVGQAVVSLPGRWDAGTGPPGSGRSARRVS
jgi:hypothetical protein